MPFKFNPFSGNFDQTGSGGGGGGSAFFAGEVATYADLPLDGTAALNSRWLVRSNSGTWPFSSYKQAGVYVRTATGGTDRGADYTLTDTSFHDVMSDSAFVLFDDGDATKNLKFQLSGIDTATTRTLTAPNASGTIQLTGHSSAHASSGSDPLYDQDLNTTDAPTFTSVSAVGNVGTLQMDDYGLVWEGARRWDVETSTFQDGNEAPILVLPPSDPDSNPIQSYAAIDFSGANAVTNAATTLTNLGAASDDHIHGNLTNDGKIGSTAGLPVVTTTAGAVTTLALGTAGQVLTVNSGATGVEFAAASGGGVTGAASSASDVLGVSGSDITGVDATADRIVFWDDSASALKYLEAGSGLSISGTTLTATASGGSKTYAVFTAEHNQPPSTAFATLDTRNSIAVLDFDAASDENAVFVGIMPEASSLGSGLIVRLHWMATSATSGNVRWGVQFERSNTDLDSDSFDTAVEATTATNGTSGIITTTAITVTTIDGITAGDVFRLKVFRNADDATNDTMTGDAELVAVEVRSAA